MLSLGHRGEENMSIYDIEVTKTDGTTYQLDQYKGCLLYTSDAADE